MRTLSRLPRRFAAVAALGLVVLGAGPAQADQSFWGGVVGASLGGYLGSTIGHGSGRLAATGLGVATGALIGSSIGSTMDRVDRGYGGGGYYAPTSYTYERPVYVPTYVAPPEPRVRVVYVQQPVYVSGGYVGDSYSYAPPPSRTCRPYTQTTRVGNQIRQVSGYACRNYDGSWQLQ